MPLGRVSAYVGSVSLICTLIILNIFLVMGGIVQEKKDKVQLFILSLPVSTAQYTWRRSPPTPSRSSVPWLVLTIGDDRGHRRLRDPERHRALLAGRARLPPVVLLRAARGRAGLRIRPAGTRPRSPLATSRSTFSFRFCSRLPSVSPTAGRARLRSGPRDIVAIVAAEIAAGAARAWPRCLPPIAHRGTLCKEHSCPPPIDLHALDAVRAFALLLGVVFHAGFSFIPGMIPGLWAITDSSPSATDRRAAVYVAHLPDVAVLLHGRVLRAHAVPASGRARLLVEPGEAHPRAADRRLGRHLPRASPWCGSGG